MHLSELGWGSLQRSPDALTGGEKARFFFPIDFFCFTRPLFSAIGLEFWPFGPQGCTPRDKFLSPLAVSVNLYPTQYIAQTM